MKNERTLSMEMPDKLYLAMTKAAEQKGITIAELVRMLCTEWVMEQNQDIKGILTYSEKLLEGMTLDERTEYLETIAAGGYVYNQHSEAVFDEDDDGEDDDSYESLCSPEEAAESERKIKEGR